MKCDVCIIGAGSAGLMAAIATATQGAVTVIIERNTIAGRKLLHTGRGRCNLTHAGTVDELVKAYGPFGRFLRHCLHEFGPQQLCRYFEDRKLQTKVEKDGCIFPITDRATDVSRVLVTHCRQLAVRFLYGRTVTCIEKTTEGFVTSAGQDRVLSQSVIIATGGVSWPFTGSTGDGYKFAESLGHSLVPPRACLVPLTTVESWPASLAGVGVENVRVTARIDNRNIITSGPIMFTSDGIGGPAVFDLSRLITDFLPRPAEPVKLAIDLLVEHNSQQLDSQLIQLCAANPKKELAGVLARLLPRSLMLWVCGQLSPSGQILAGQLEKAKRRHLLGLLKKMPLSVKATRPLAEATVTRGGVSTDELDPRTMQSKICPRLFFAGEVINVDGPCGGYNLQICWSTGALAGRSAAAAR